MDTVLNKSIEREVLTICRKIGSPHVITAISTCNIYESKSKNRKKELKIMLVLKSSKLIFQYSTHNISKGQIAILTVDQKTFERDIQNDWLGGLIVENIFYPYEPLLNSEFLWEQEIKAKKRIVKEILFNLVLEYPRMVSEFLIKPEYFLFEEMSRKSALYPPIAFKFMKIIQSENGENNRKLIMKGFHASLDAMRHENLLEISDGYIKITKKSIDEVQKRKVFLRNILKNVRSSILRHAFEVFPKMMRNLMEDYIQYIKCFVIQKESDDFKVSEIEDTNKHIFLSTSNGIVSLSNSITIKDFTKDTFLEEPDTKYRIIKVGGVLNSVYRINTSSSNKKRIIIAKEFRNWYGWKWFPLALWTLGTRDFAVQGKSRLEREYVFNRHFSDQGINVPKILHINLKRRMIFQEYIKGRNLSTIVKETLLSSRYYEPNLLGLFGKVGAEIAKIHRLGYTLGDCKPENIIISEDEKIYFIDLEQADKSGNESWDIAEFIYYLGHYASFSNIDATQEMVKNFLEGYLEGGGKAKSIKKALSPQYTKIFSFLTAPHTIILVSGICEKILLNKEKNDDRGFGKR